MRIYAKLKNRSPLWGLIVIEISYSTNSEPLCGSNKVILRYEL
jgi:hypothetical protein